MSNDRDSQASHTSFINNKLVRCPSVDLNVNASWHELRTMVPLTNLYVVAWSLAISVKANNSKCAILKVCRTIAH